MTKMEIYKLVMQILKYIFKMPPKAGLKTPQVKSRKLSNDPDDHKYEAINNYIYYSDRYNRTVTIKKGMHSDGATGALDIHSDAWWIHDQLCDTGCFDDGHKISNWDASTVLGDVLWSEGHRMRSIYWWFATFFGGGGKARENGLVWIG